MRLRCAILDDYSDAVLKLGDWARLSDRVEVTVFNQHVPDQADVIKALQGFQIIGIIRERTPFPKAVLEALPDLKLLVSTGNRNPSIDMETAKARGITVCGTDSAGSSTASLAIGLMLELTRKIGLENVRLHQGESWQTTLGIDLEGKTLGLLGLGKLGAKVAAIGKAMEMNTIAWSQNLTPERCAELGVTHVSREELFTKSDVLSIHLVPGSRNRGLVGRDDLARMKKTAYLVNTSRAVIIQEEALMEALRERRIAGAGLDVFWTEPLPVDHPIRKMDNVVITPHLGYVTEENYRAAFSTMVDGIEAWFAGKPIRLMG